MDKASSTVTFRTGGTAKFGDETGALEALIPGLKRGFFLVPSFWLTCQFSMQKTLHTPKFFNFQSPNNQLSTPGLNTCTTPVTPTVSSCPQCRPYSRLNFCAQNIGTASSHVVLFRGLTLVLRISLRNSVVRERTMTGESLYSRQENYRPIAGLDL